MLNVMNGSTNGKEYSLQEKPYELANPEENLQEPGQLEQDLSGVSPLKSKEPYKIAFLDTGQAESNYSDSISQAYDSA